jgi:hypothetical protein
LGTAFFVSVRSSVDGGRFVYLVTAKHNLENFDNSELYLSINSTLGDVRAVLLEEPRARWWFHPTDASVDVAVMSFPLDKIMDITTVDMEDMCLTPESIERYHVGIGDEVFIAGLFTPVSGNGRNVPIVRHGNVAMLPHERVELDAPFGPSDVYLIEARSIGGISGSPVFVRETINIEVTDEQGEKLRLHGNGRVFLMGLVHGHWDVEESRKNNYQVVHNRPGGVNMGIAIVVPASKILETLNQPGLVEFRASEDKKMRAKMIPGKDSTGPEDKSTPHERFSRLASRVVSVPREEIMKREAEFRSSKESEESEDSTKGK